MNGDFTMRNLTVVHVLSSAVLGALAALLLGLLAVAMAPNNGFADLAAAAVTRVLVIPLGGLIGAVVGYRRGR